MSVLVPFAATIVSLRLAGALLRRWRETARPELVSWALSLVSFGAASAALAWGGAYGWNDAVFKVYYLFGGLLTAALLGLGSLRRAGVRWIRPVAVAYIAFSVGVALAVEPTSPVTGGAIPAASDHLALVPARALAFVGNVGGTAAAVGVALLGLRRRPLGNALVLAGIATAALGSALAGLGESGSAAFSLVAVVLLYCGFVVRR
ncbi:MAG: hypothetical protein U0R50_15845 [Gaiellales bacterium]